MYHGIDQTENTRFNVRFFSANNFERHLLFYKKHFNIISLEDYFEDRNLDRHRLNIAITFDDGYRNNFTLARPLLERHEVPATFFVTGLNAVSENILWADLIDLAAGFHDAPILFQGRSFPKSSRGRYDTLRVFIQENKIVGTPVFAELKSEILRLKAFSLDEPGIFDYWQLMSDEEIASMASSKFVRIGSHGFLHNNMRYLPLSESAAELKASKEYLENLLQYEVLSVGYPNGGYTREVLDEAQRLGYKYQCAVDYLYPQDAADPRVQNRLGLYPRLSQGSLNYEIHLAAQ
jgi:peptidoglycan/xylan/chitin deacetylase (PgdA/CDA1 family)